MIKDPYKFSKIVPLSEEEENDSIAFSELAGNYYRKTIKGIGKTVLAFTGYIPARRAKIQHTGYLGYSRKIESISRSFPREIKFTATLYSLGIPPELLRMGKLLEKHPVGLKLISTSIPGSGQT